MISKINGDKKALSAGDKLIISACVHKIKHSGKLTFIYLRSNQKILKTVYKNGDKNCPVVGSYIKAYADVINEIKADNGLEIRISDFKILSVPHINAPVALSQDSLSLGDVINYKSFTIRDPYFAYIYKVRNTVISAFCDFMEKNGFVRFDSPVISQFSEHDSFMIDYFGENAYLPFSPQLYMTAGTAAFERVYEIAHSFSAKKHNSSRHLNEFTSLNFQSGYIDTVDDIISIVSEYIYYTLDYLKDIELSENIEIPANNSIPVFEFTSVLSLLGKPSQPDIDPTDIKKLCLLAKEKYGSDFVFVKNFPAKKRMFYIEEYGGYAQCFDLLFKGAKIAAGSKNICDYDIQLKKMHQMNINPKDCQVYTDTLKYGIMPYGGFMAGVERFTARLIDSDNIRWASLFPRDLHHFMP